MKSRNERVYEILGFNLFFHYTGVGSDKSPMERTDLTDGETKISSAEKIGAAIETFLERSYYKLGMCKYLIFFFFE